MPFRPERSSEPEEDGAGLTKLGRRFREVFAELHDLELDDVDLGMVRLVEALNADTDRNHAALSSLHVKHTEHGRLIQARLIVNTVMLLPWLLNGRALRRLASALRGETKLLTSAVDHERLALPTMRVETAESVLEIVHAQRSLLELDNYTTAAKKRERIDSIVRFGVLDPPDVVLTELVSDDGRAWSAQVAEGAQRLFSSLVAMDALTVRSAGSLATAHWFSDGEAKLRDLTPEDLLDLEEQLRFRTTAAAGYFPGADEEAWLTNTAETTPAAVAFQLMRTMVINLTICIEPDPVTGDERNPVAGTIQELIRSYHVPGKMKDAWNQADVHGLIAIGAIDELVEQGRVTAPERSAWLGEHTLAWNEADDSSTGNSLVSTTKLLAAITTRGAIPAGDDFTEDSLEVVNRFLRQNSVRVHSDDRAKVAAAQAVVSLGVHNSGDEGTISAALFGAFHHGWFWRAEEDGINWPELLAMPISELAEEAQRERQKNSTDSSDEAGPAQRAIAALGAVALTCNPGLIAEGDALTRTGRGGGGKVTTVRASDPAVLLQRMVREERGIHQLQDAVAALTVNAEPTIPVDRVTNEVLSDLYLRKLWFGDGEVKENPQAEFARQIQNLVDALDECATNAERLQVVTPDELLEVDDDDREDEFQEEPLYEVIGINEQTAEVALTSLHALSDFFQTGKAFARAAARANR